MGALYDQIQQSVDQDESTEDLIAELRKIGWAPVEWPYGTDAEIRFPIQGTLQEVTQAELDGLITPEVADQILTALS